MPVPYYDLKELPPGLFDASKPEPFRHAMTAWRKLGLGAVVDRVTGNGTLHELDDRKTTRLIVWPDGDDMPCPTIDLTTVVVDNALTISWNGDTPPGPDDLTNGNPLRLSAVPLVLGDGNIWQIPEIREPSGSLLPTDLTRDRITGSLLNPIKREYVELWNEGEFWFDLKWQAITGEATTFALSRALAFATQILGLRYRFCDATQSALRIIDGTNVQQIIEFAIGWPAVVERIKELTHDVDQKKREAVSVVSANGSYGVAV